ncbi:MAG: hypothetical protein H0W47_04585 [Polaromonas sp.]|uniref:DUF6196 family protein n=1 Tax=Polaromonas sp. TaxID=1869339 RepID=UPI0017C31A36|nr:DUF6196 family protein [Polaromonas sp.]MBA3593061.1 hypothetical protein [Polaromonas sp.]
MDISPETPEQTRRRLLRVMAHARVDVLPGDHTFAEFPMAQFPAHLASSLASSALALVRDQDVWSALLPAPAQTPAQDCCAVVCVHFAPDIPNSGFVGWLASELKQQLGTGVFVVCGQNSADGGIFDYWGIPRGVAAQAIQIIHGMQTRGASA